MWNSFFRAFLVLTLVLGCNEVCFSIYWHIKRNRLLALRWLLRGASSIVISSFSLWRLMTSGRDAWDDTWLWVLMLCFAPATIGVEAFLRVHVERKPLRTLFEQPEKITSTTWERTRAFGKTRFITMYVLVLSLMLVEPAIVFSLVSPELLSPYWWPLLIVAFGLAGFVIGYLQWTSNEKQFKSRNTGID